MTNREVVEAYFAKHYRPVFWAQIGDLKGPKEEGWPTKNYTIADYRDGVRVGLLTGIEVTSGQFLHDVDIDWAPGAAIAQAFLPATDFIYGRASKKISHCFYLLREAIISHRFEDIDKTCIIELRGTKKDGTIGLQTMAPPSIWSQGPQRESLVFLRSGDPALLEDTVWLIQRVTLAAIGMLLAKHLGRNGFGHDARLAWAGFLLRADVNVEDLVTMGEAMSIHCNNIEVQDVRRTVESTRSALAAESKKIRGGPSLAKLLGTQGRAIITRINEWLGRTGDFVRSEGVIVKDSQRNIRRAIELFNHDLSYNAFADKILIDGQVIEDRQMTDLWLRTDEEHHFRPTYMFFEKVVHKLAWDNPFHPVKDYLATLTWDGLTRIDTWLSDFGGVSDTPYVRAISAIVLIAAVRRIRHPGTKYDELLVLEGAQGLNKSSALRALCPKGSWFSDDLPLNTTSQKLIEATLGKWIIEAADLAGRRKTEIEHLKATLSRQVDGPARLAYAHLPVERPRQFIIIGTTNSSAYLPDPTGARRFWPVAVTHFDVVKLLALRDQLWAEANVREAAGAAIRLPEQLWPEAAQHQEQRREVDPWESTIGSTLYAIAPSGDGKRRIAADDIWNALHILVDKRDRAGAIRIADIMQRLGFKRTTVRANGSACAGYITEKAELLEVAELEEIVTVQEGEPPF